MLPVEQASFFTFSGGQKQSRCECQCGTMQVPHESFFVLLLSRSPRACLSLVSARLKNAKKRRFFGGLKNSDRLLNH